MGRARAFRGTSFFSRNFSSLFFPLHLLSPLSIALPWSDQRGAVLSNGHQTPCFTVTTWLYFNISKQRETPSQFPALHPSTINLWHFLIRPIHSLLPQQFLTTPPHLIIFVPIEKVRRGYICLPAQRHRPAWMRVIKRKRLLWCVHSGEETYCRNKTAIKAHRDIGEGSGLPLMSSDIVAAVRSGNCLIIIRRHEAAHQPAGVKGTE